MKFKLEIEFDSQEELLAFFRQRSSIHSLGGKARWEKMTPHERAASIKNLQKAREGNANGK
jgi:hypothetical protein